MNRNELIEILAQTTATIRFTKKDGTARVMVCTLRSDIVVPHEKTTDRVKAVNENILPVWDIEANAWRSVTIDAITTLGFTLGPATKA